MNVDRMLRSITHKQLVEWQAFSELEPFDETRQDVRIASIQATLAEIHRNPEKRRKPWTFADFLVPFGDEPKRETPDSLTEQVPRQNLAEMKFLAQMMVASSIADDPANRKKHG